MDIVRKLALVGFVVLVGSGSIEQIMLSAFLCFGFSCLQSAYSPYKISVDNTLRMTTEVHMFVAILIAFVVHCNEDVHTCKRVV